MNCGQSTYHPNVAKADIQETTTLRTFRLSLYRWGVVLNSRAIDKWDHREFAL